MRASGYRVLAGPRDRSVVLHPPAIVAVFPFHFPGLPVDEADRIEATKADQDVAVEKRCETAPFL